MVVEGRGNNRGEGFGTGHVLSGCVPRHGGDKGIGYNEGGGGGMVLGGGGVKEMQGHTGDEKTTKRWEADDRARDRLK